MKNLLIKQNCYALLEECASAAFGKNVIVNIVDKNDFAELDISLFTEKKKTEDEPTDDDSKEMTDEDFSKSIDILKQMSNDSGFEISGLDTLTPNPEENESMYSDENGDN